MTSLSDLPTEIVISIFAACPIIDAVHLSQTSQRFRNIWLEHAEQIIQSIIEPIVPAYNDAFEFAVVEMSSTSVSFWLPALLKNAKLAAHACAEYNTWFDQLSSDDSCRRCEYTLLPASYYVIRQLVHAWDHRERIPILNAMLEASPQKELRTHWELVDYMTGRMDAPEEKIHGIPNYEDPWAVIPPEIEDAINDGWQFAVQLIERVEKGGTFWSKNIDDTLKAVINPI